GPIVVAEADESDGAFLVYRPHAALVTNVDADHLDVWGTEDAYREGFAEFVGTVDVDGVLVLCADDPGAAALAPVARRRGLDVVTVGAGPGNDWTVTEPERTGGNSSFTVTGDGLSLAVTLQVPGRHYVLDAAGALVLALRLVDDVPGLVRGLGEFTGTGRRMERKGEAGGV